MYPEIVLTIQGLAGVPLVAHSSVPRSSTLPQSIGPMLLVPQVMTIKKHQAFGPPDRNPGL